MWTLARLALFSALLVGLLGAASAATEAVPSWPGWRGPGQDGHSDDTRVPLRWSRTENLRWQTDLPGVGNSSPVVWGDRVFLTAADPKGTQRWVLCVDRRSGKILWQRTAAKGLPAEPVHAWNTHASATCATDG